MLLIIHGFGEHSGRYENLAQHLAAQGYAVYAPDLRGHGGSEGQRGHIDRWLDYRSDLATLYRYMEIWEGSVPGFLYGHSMGSLVVLEYLTGQAPGVRGAIVSGVLLEPGQPAHPLLVAAARFLSRHWPNAPLWLNLSPKALSRDPEVVRAYRKDPLVHNRASARWGTEVLRTIELVKEEVKSIQRPLLILHGEADTISRVEGARWLFREVSSADKELRIYPGGFHEPHNDLCKDQVLQDISEWLERHL
ncbi:alpha/beta hydrolase [Meiothermus sp.]|jgi:alpha-beta hydrolase superfamily lysophospholipase|uniref:alpha/beta hydrolase n=1 Tax=Meiothermus sp. TaxID=1955249 RepID=UPI002614BA29|nr:alpha/beta hydrolase [Meiothermus sp.]